MNYKKFFEGSTYVPIISAMILQKEIRSRDHRKVVIDINNDDEEEEEDDEHSIESKWKERRDYLIRNGINDPRQWAKCGQEVIQNHNFSGFGMESNDELKLVLLFKETFD